MTVTVKAMVEAADAVVPRITGAEAIALAKQPGVVIVDVRDTGEVKLSGKAKGAFNIPRGSLEFSADPALPTHNKALADASVIIVHCAAGSRAAFAGKTLRDMGYTDVRNMVGFKHWVEAGGEVEPA